MGSLVVAAIAVPVLGSLFTPLLREKLRPIWAFSIAILTCVVVDLLLLPIIQGETIVIKKNLAMAFDLYFVADGLSVFMAVVSSLVGMLIILYSIGYMKDYKNLGEYYFLVVLFIGSMMGLVFSANLLLMYIFWEIAAICSWRLIGFYRKPQHIKNADKAFLITFGSASVMLIGFILVYMNSGTFNILELRGATISNLAFLLIFIGIMGKSTVFPLHTWLPDAGVAPSPVTALLHAAVLVKIGIYAFARLFCYTFQMPSWGIYVPILALISSLIAGACALVETDMKRILAQSTISQLGFILFGLSLKSGLGIAGALTFILAHAIGKAGLFLSAGVVEHKTGIKDIRKLGGMMKTFPITGAAFLLCALSVMGVPPLIGFFGKLMIISSPIKEGKYFLGAVAIITSIFTLLYLLRLFNAVFLGESTHPEVREGSKTMLISICILAILSLAGGILVMFPMKIIEVARAQLMIFR